MSFSVPEYSGTRINYIQARLSPMAEDPILKELSEAVLDGQAERTKELTHQALDEGIAPMRIIREGMAPGAKAAGDKFADGDYFLPDLTLAGEAMNGALDIILPKMTAEDEAQNTGKVVLGSVEGDVHDIGKNITSALLRSNGFTVIDLGVDVPVDDFVSKIEEEEADILGLGCYMSTGLTQIEKNIEALEEAGLREEVSVMLGGVAVHNEFTKESGADAYGEDAHEAVKVAEKLMESGRPTAGIITA